MKYVIKWSWCNAFITITGTNLNLLLPDRHRRHVMSSNIFYKRNGNDHFIGAKWSSLRQPIRSYMYSLYVFQTRKCLDDWIPFCTISLSSSSIQCHFDCTYVGRSRGSFWPYLVRVMVFKESGYYWKAFRQFNRNRFVCLLFLSVGALVVNPSFFRHK